MSPLSHVHRFEPGAGLPAAVPAKAGTAAPPLLLLHGTGGSENDLIPLAQRLSPGSALLSPRGEVNENGARRFFARLAEGVFDPAEIIRRTHALADFVTAAAQHYRLDLGRLVAFGFSNGANAAASLLLLRPETLAGAVLLRPMVVLEPAEIPDLSGRRVLIASGAADPIVPGDHPLRLAKMLRQAGARVILRTHDAGHGLVPADFNAAREFLAHGASG